MPGYRKRVYKKRAYKKRKGGVAKKALRKVNALARKMKPEIKFVDFKIPGTEFQTNGEIFDLCKTIPNGTSNVSREGRKIRIVRLTGIMQMELDSASTSDAFRFIVFRGNNNDGKNYHVGSATTGSGEIPLLNDTDVYPLISRKVDDQSKMSRFIYDKTYTLDVGKFRMLTKKINFRLGWETQYKAYPVDTSIIVDGGLYIAGMTNSEGASTTSMNFRLWYTDV